MSFLRHREIYPFDEGVVAPDHASAHRLDGFPAGYSLAVCTPAWPAFASPTDSEYAVESSRRSTAFHRTANSVLTICFRRGGERRQSALAARLDDPFKKERERLRSTYDAVRTAAAPIAESIARDLPDYTVHDISHLDALWEYAELIAGPTYPLTPCEAFVLGCAFLVHDLGMGLAAYPEGLQGLKQHERWKDLEARQRGDKKFGKSSSAGPSGVDEEYIIAEMLRHLHAERAASLASVYWTDPDDRRFYLIDDHGLREAFGPVIGRVAHSHWWPVDRILKEFPTIMGALAGFPQIWTVDAAKLACILRCADYAQIDDRRAPSFIRALRWPRLGADDHWRFQNKLYQPRIEGDRLIFPAKNGFNVSEASAWWLCFDTLRGLD